jgi:LCP family protein required for cell wall assembly
MQFPPRVLASSNVISKRRVLALVALVLLVLGTWAGWRAYSLYREANDMIVVVPRSTLEPTAPPVAVAQRSKTLFDQQRRINILVLGSDNDTKKEEINPPTQSMIVVSIDPVNHKVTLLSIPRDFWVPVRGKGMQKIMLAYKYGRVELARETVEKLFHINIDRYAWVGLDGFISVVDTFNGVTLDVKHPILDDSYPQDITGPNAYAYQRVFIPPGWAHLKGDLALKYVRSRHGSYLGDFDRSARQQQVLVALKAKAHGLDLLRNIPALIDELHAKVRTDMGPSELYSAMSLARQVKGNDIQRVVLQAPTYAQLAMRAGQDVVLPNWSKIFPVVKRLFTPVHPILANPGRRITLKPNPTATPVPTATATPGPHPTTSPPATATPAPTPSPTPVPVPFHTSASLLFINQWNSNLYQWNPDGSVNQLTNTGDVTMPSPSPDGRTVAVVRFPRYRDVSDIWLLDRRTGKMRALTHGRDPKDVRNNLWDAWPTWSSDGSHLLYSSDLQKRAQPPTDARSSALAVWSLPVKGGTPTQLTVPQVGSMGDEDPVLRPHSQQFAYVKWSFYNSNFQIYSQLMIDDPVVRRTYTLTPVGGRVLQPAWDAAGNRLSFIRVTNGVDELAVAHVVHTASGPQLRHAIVLARGEVAQPSFTPDGRWISYLRPVGDAFALYVVRATGGPSYRVSSLSNQIDARWRPVWVRH